MPSYVVTGSNRGLGYAFLVHLAAIPGNTVIGLARDVAKTKEKLATDGINNVHVFAADITDIKALQLAAEETAKITGGSLDVLINNAGYVSKQSAWSSLPDITPEALEEDLLTSFKINVVGVAHTISAFLPLIRKGQQKKVITISTGMADLDFTNHFTIPIAGPYAVSKAGTNELVAKYNAAAGKAEGILFMSISPGVVATSDEPPTEQDMAGAQAMFAMFSAYAPDFKGPMQPAESVQMVMQVVDKATVETMGGAFVSHFGTKQWL
ncbi:hypothetical protein BAUCODRAFT_379497 [Baudoinia panamericana UAMH 10762]|uniref:NAD(P)-binding protein n=1 Tax=Baudoinia panamericana (strain UAMH 10762) TaxID=717646 RepID=M2N435_BAUPA|nr:uncharacterized protein BAUCODRAFT_379497 [Baudoinia panamericana UAMH 10762]EMC98748.1 hypothetical protein BAUCODRAFT_379497 [Baudoinia panamericana UAMH 10762]